MGKPTIFFMNRVYPPARGATGRLLRDLAESFVRDGWDVTVVSSAPAASDEIINGVRVLRVRGAERPRKTLSYMWIWLKMFLCAMRLKRPHLLVTMSDPPLLIVVGYIVAKLKGARHINWCQDLYPDVMPALGMKLPDFLMGLFQSLRIRAMKHAAKVIVCGRCMRVQLVQDGVDKEDHIVMISNWPDPELTDPDMVEVRGVPYQKFNADIARSFQKQIKRAQRFRVLYAGNIGLAHPVEPILQAAAVFEGEKSDIEFVFIGDGPRFDYIAAQRSKRGLDNVRLLPYQPVSSLRETMESGDVHLISMCDQACGFIVPSKIYSALAVARPCIFLGPRESEVAQVVSDFACGLVVAEGDAENLVNAIRYFRESAEAWFEAHRGASQAREHFTPEASIAAWVACAREAVGG